MSLLKYKKFKGLHIVCKGCNRNIEVTQTPYNGCNHPISKQRYKGLYRINGKRTTKDLKSLTYEDAVIELLEWKKQLDNPIKIKLSKRLKDVAEKTHKSPTEQGYQKASSPTFPCRAKSFSFLSFFKV